MDIEKRLKRAMADGWNIRIECKANYRNYPLTYEAQMINFDVEKLKDTCFNTIVFAETLEELLNELFGERYM